MLLFVCFIGVSCIVNFFGFSMFWGIFVVYELCVRFYVSVGVFDFLGIVYIVFRRGYVFIFLC